MSYVLFYYCVVRLIGLEPTRITTPDPKSGASTNFATSAGAISFNCGAKVGNIFQISMMVGEKYFPFMIMVVVYV